MKVAKRWSEGRGKEVNGCDFLCRSICKLGFVCVFHSSLHFIACHKDFPVVINGVGDPYLSRCNPSGDQRVV